MVCRVQRASVTFFWVYMHICLWTCMCREERDSFGKSPDNAFLKNSINYHRQLGFLDRKIGGPSCSVVLGEWVGEWILVISLKQTLGQERYQLNMIYFHLSPSGENWLPGEAQLISEYSSKLCIVFTGKSTNHKALCAWQNEQVQMGERTQARPGGDAKRILQGYPCHRHSQSFWNCISLLEKPTPKERGASSQE